MPEPSVRTGGTTARRSGRRRRWLPRTGPRTSWPMQAHRAGQIAVLVTVLLLICGFLLVRYSPERFLRLVGVYRSLPVAVVSAVLVSGVIYFAVDSLRLMLVEYLAAARIDPWRRRLLLGTLGLWLLLTMIATVLILWYPSSVLFGGDS